MLPIALVAIFGVLFVLRSMAPRGLMKVGISMLQIIANANSVYNIPWPSDFSNLLDVMKVFLVGTRIVTRWSVGIDNGLTCFEARSTWSSRCPILTLLLQTSSQSRRRTVPHE